MIAMEDIDGSPLSTLVQSKQIDLQTFLSLGIALAQGVGEIHHSHVIHKDIKPQNIIVNLQKRQTKIIDFGIATILSREVQQIANLNVLEGTLAYISPEQTGRMNRAIDYRTDIYSLGVTLYEMATSQLPFISSDFLEIMHQHIAKAAKPPHEVLPSIPQSISAIIMKCLEKSAEDRYRSAYGLKNDLEECQRQLDKKGSIAFFSPGLNDIYDQFQIPQKLYGREKELQALLNVFEHCCTGQAHLLEVKGYAGIGKSSLVNEIQKSIVEKQGLFLQGKFDQFKKNIPYSAIIQAFEGLVQQLLAKAELELKEWKRRLLKALGANGQVIIDVIPDIKLIIGDQPPIPKLDERSAETRFNFTFSNFIEAFLQEESPLVLFLDDVQWADISSLKLLEIFMSDISHQYLLIICAYRDNEMTPLHLFRLTLDNIQKSGGCVETLDIKPLTLEAMQDFISDAFHNTREQIAALSRIVFNKTKGNPFFAIQFLKRLYQDSLLNFDTEKQCWMGNLKAIEGVQVSDNVADLMTTKIFDLEVSTQELLKTAAAIGNTFELQAIARIHRISPSQAAAQLWPAVKAELIILKQTPYTFDVNEDIHIALDAVIVYSFQHDRIQQAAYELTPQAERPHQHLHIGRILLQGTPPEMRNEMIIGIVNHLNYGLELIDTPEERSELAYLNLAAGKKAMDSSAFTPALQYFQNGLSLLHKDSWEAQYELCLSLHENLGICQNITGLEEIAQGTLDFTILHAKTAQEKGRIYILKIVFYGQQAKIYESYQCGVEALRLFNINLKAQPTKRDEFFERMQLEARLCITGLKSILKMPLAKEEATLTIGSIYSALAYTSYNMNAIAFTYIILKTVNFTFKYGMAPYGCHVLQCYASLIVSGRFDNSLKGIKISAICLEALGRFPKSATTAQTQLVYWALTNTWLKHLKIAIPHLKMVESECAEAGLVAYAAACLYYTSLLLLLKGENLSLAYQEIEKNVLQAKKYRAIAAGFITLTIFETCKALRGLTNNPTDPRPAELEKMLQIKNPQGQIAVAHLYYLFWRLFLLYMHGEYRASIDIAATVSPKEDMAVPPNPQWVLYYLYYPLSLTALYFEQDPPQRLLCKKMLAKYLKKIKKFSQTCPETFLHKYLLLLAEKCRIEKRKAEAIALYSQAIAEANKQGFLHEEALGYELTAAFYLEQGQKPQEAFHLHAAYSTYERWGAHAKLRQLKVKYSNLLTPFQDITASFKEGTAATKSTSLTTFSSNIDYDIKAIIQAAQTISGEIVLDKLVAKLMHILVVNAGADQAYLLLVKQKSLIIYGEAKLGAEGTSPIKPTYIEEKHNEICLAAAYYVQNSKQILVLNDATREGNFSQDPYVMAHHPQSILCMPLIHQGKLTGIVYLENKICKDAFSPERLRILSLLSSQMAISIENALFYGNLEEKVEERTLALKEKNQELERALQQLRTMQNQLVQQEKMASLGLLTAGMAHEIKNPLNFVINFSELSQNLIRQMDEFMHRNEKVISQDDWKENYEYLQDLKTNNQAIQDQGLRADDIVKKMSELATKQTSKMPTPLNHFLEQSISEFQKKMLTQNPLFEVQIDADYDLSIQNIDLSREDIGRVLHNLLDNAYSAMLKKKQSSATSFVPTLSVKTRQLGYQVEISIRDNGTGIPEVLKNQVFNPFFTTKNSGSGIGLGLSLSYNIISQQHQGNLSFLSEEGVFTEFTIILPTEDLDKNNLRF